MSDYVTRDGDVLDHVCWRHYQRDDLVVTVLEANRGLADIGPVLPSGLTIVLPDPPAPAPRPVIRLWS